MKALVDGDGEGSTDEPITMAEALKQETGFTENKKVEDKYGNVFILPSGFKIVPNGEDKVVYNKDDAHNPTVQDGIVIEDATNGNQFVWIPVGTLKKENGETDTTIALERRTFNADGTVNKHMSNGTIGAGFIEQTKAEQEQDGQNYGNAIAKDIVEFKNGVANNGGYYLARFEASKGTGETELKSVADKAPWVSIKQSVASENCKEMYVESDIQKYQSDLVNSYAWDTAIYFIQECSTEKAYAMKKGTDINSNKVNTGINADRPCNICDMAGNVAEWSTETSTSNNRPCVRRGGYYPDSNYYASFRHNGITDDANTGLGFRPVLYVK